MIEINELIMQERVYLLNCLLKLMRRDLIPFGVLVHSEMSRATYRNSGTISDITLR